MVDGLETIIDKDKLAENVVIVCHGGVIATIMHDLFPEGRDHLFHWVPNPGRGYSLAVRDGNPYDFSDI